MNANVLTYAALYAAFRVRDLCCVLLVPNVAVKDENTSERIVYRYMYIINAIILTLYHTLKYTS